MTGTVLCLCGAEAEVVGSDRVRRRFHLLGLGDGRFERYAGEELRMQEAPAAPIVDERADGDARDVGLHGVRRLGAA